MYHATFRWEFVSDDEAWITHFIVEAEDYEFALQEGTKMLNNHVKKMYLGEEIKIVKSHIDPVEPGFVREWRPRK